MRDLFFFLTKRSINNFFFAIKKKFFFYVIIIIIFNAGPISHAARGLYISLKMSFKSGRGAAMKAALARVFKENAHQSSTGEAREISRGRAPTRALSDARRTGENYKKPINRVKL